MLLLALVVSIAIVSISYERLVEWWPLMQEEENLKVLDNRQFLLTNRHHIGKK